MGVTYDPFKVAGRGPATDRQVRTIHRLEARLGKTLHPNPWKLTVREATAIIDEGNLRLATIRGGGA